MPSGVKVCIRARPTATFAQDNIIVHVVASLYGRGRYSTTLSLIHI